MLVKQLRKAVDLVTCFRLTKFNTLRDLEGYRTVADPISTDSNRALEIRNTPVSVTELTSAFPVNHKMKAWIPDTRRTMIFTTRIHLAFGECIDVIVGQQTTQVFHFLIPDMTKTRVNCLLPDIQRTPIKKKLKTSTREWHRYKLQPEMPSLRRGISPAAATNLPQPNVHRESNFAGLSRNMILDDVQDRVQLSRSKVQVLVNSNTLSVSAITKRVVHQVPMGLAASEGSVPVAAMSGKDFRDETILGVFENPCKAVAVVFVHVNKTNLRTKRIYKTKS